MYVCVYGYACARVCMYLCMYVCMYVCMHACMHACKCLYGCVCVCIYACMYVYMHVCTYVYSHINMQVGQSTCINSAYRKRTAMFVIGYRISSLQNGSVDLGLTAILRLLVFLGSGWRYTFTYTSPLPLPERRK